MKTTDFMTAFRIACTLEGAEVLDRFSITEIKGIYNGIGSDVLPDWLRQLITEVAGVFEPAAILHDVEYHIGGNWEKFTEVNSRFERNCKELVKRKFGWYNPKRYIWLNKARRWANYCQLFGWQSFNKESIK